MSCLDDLSSCGGGAFSKPSLHSSPPASKGHAHTHSVPGLPKDTGRASRALGLTPLHQSKFKESLFHFLSGAFEPADALTPQLHRDLQAQQGGGMGFPSKHQGASAQNNQRGPCGPGHTAGQPHTQGRDAGSPCLSSPCQQFPLLSPPQCADGEAAHGPLVIWSLSTALLLPPRHSERGSHSLPWHPQSPLPRAPGCP